MGRLERFKGRLTILAHGGTIQSRRSSRLGLPDEGKSSGDGRLFYGSGSAD